jgi:hypothetical protein
MLQSAAGQPFNPYPNNPIAPINPQEYAGIGNVNQYAFAAQPQLQGASNLAAASSMPLTASTIQQYMSPYLQSTVNATQNAFANQNAQQAKTLNGQMIANGSFGGNARGVQQAALAGQQQTAESPVIAGLENTGYNTALQTAMGEQGIGQAGANILGNLGLSEQTAGLQGAQAQIGAGQLEQNNQQAYNNWLLSQFQAQNAYPFQTANFLASGVGGLGPLFGGTTTQQTPINPLSYAGLGLGLLGAGGQLFGAKGGGAIEEDGARGYDIGGMPYAMPSGLGGGDNADYLTTMGKTGNGGGPSANYMPSTGVQIAPHNPFPQIPNQSTASQNPLGTLSQQMGLVQNAGKAFSNSSLGDQTQDWVQDNVGSGATDAAFGLDDTSGDWTGGRVRGLDTGGVGDIPDIGEELKKRDEPPTDPGVAAAVADARQSSDIPAPTSGIGPATSDFKPPPSAGNDYDLGRPGPAFVNPTTGNEVNPNAPSAERVAAVPGLGTPLPRARPTEGLGEAGATERPQSEKQRYWAELEQQRGLPPGTLARMSYFESRGNPRSYNEHSGAKGEFQFLDSTRATYPHNPWDWRQSARAAADYAAANMRGLETEGIKPTAANLYLAHQQGLGGATTLLNHPNIPPALLGLGRNVAANEGNPWAPAGQFTNHWLNKPASDEGAATQGLVARAPDDEGGEGPAHWTGAAPPGRHGVAPADGSLLDRVTDKFSDPQKRHDFFNFLQDLGAGMMQHPTEAGPGGIGRGLQLNTARLQTEEKNRLSEAAVKRQADMLQMRIDAMNKRDQHTDFMEGERLKADERAEAARGRAEAAEALRDWRERRKAWEPTRDESGNPVWKNNETQEISPTLPEDLRTPPPSGSSRRLAPSATPAPAPTQPAPAPTQPTPAPAPAPTQPAPEPTVPKTAPAPQGYSVTAQTEIPNTATDAPPIYKPNSEDGEYMQGEWQYSKGEPPQGIKKGSLIPVPKPYRIGDSVIGPDALRAEAMRYLFTGKFTRTGAGRNPDKSPIPAEQSLIENLAQAIRKSHGWTEDDIRRMQQYSGRLPGAVAGTLGQQATFAGVATGHLEELRSYAQKWHDYVVSKVGEKGEKLRLLKTAANRLTQSMGAPEASTQEVVAGFVSPELLKAIGVAGAGGEQERAHLASVFSPNTSMDQINAHIDAVEDAIHEQMKGKERSFSTMGMTPEDFKHLVGEDKYDFLEKKHQQLQGGKEEPTDAYRAWAKGNPERTKKFKAKFGVEP